MQVWLRNQTRPPLLDCYCQKTDFLRSPVVIFPKGGSPKAWSLKKERSKSSRTQPRNLFISQNSSWYFVYVKSPLEDRAPFSWSWKWLEKGL